MTTAILQNEGTLACSGSRRALAGFYVSGVTLAFLGSILPAWAHHLKSDYAVVGTYFVGLIAGMMAAVWAAPRLIEKQGLRWTLAFACGIAGTAFLYLAVFSPPFSFWWRVGGLAILGFASGLLHNAIFTTITPMYRHDPAATVNLAGMLFGLGCLTVTLLVSGAFYIYSAPAIQVWIAIIPAAFGWLYWKTQFIDTPDVSAQAAKPESDPRAILTELRSPAAILFALALFFQLGNEWAIAGWLPLFLSQRLGINPATSLLMLALYWGALLIGRIASQWILPRVKHSRMLLACVGFAVFGCIVLSATDNGFGVVSGVLMVGAAFAPIYPLLVERIGSRFPSYHPARYNGIFSIAMAGGLLAPCTLGYFASLWGVEVVMGLPLLGSFVVFALLILIWLEARFGARMV